MVSLRLAPVSLLCKSRKQTTIGTFLPPLVAMSILPAALALRPTDQIATDDLRNLAINAFADYLAGPFALSPGVWPGFLARHCVDLSMGLVAWQGDVPSGFMLVAPHPEVGRWRVAMMGLVPEARGTGVAHALLRELISRADAKGVQLELECITHNRRALSFYLRHGFACVHPLHGYEHTAATRSSNPDTALPATMRAVTVAQAFEWLNAQQVQQRELPRQTMPASLAPIAAELMAWQCGQAQLIFRHGEPGQIVLHNLFDSHPAQADAELLVRELLARHGDHTIKMVPLQRLDIGGEALARAGLVPMAISQWLMLRDHAAQRCSHMGAG
jgi:GNAT superfamily N-acetyltransferase